MVISRRSLLAGAAALVSSKALPSVSVAEPAVVNIGLSVELLIQDYMTETLNRWARELEDRFMNGSGFGPPLGIFNLPLDNEAEITSTYQRENPSRTTKGATMTPTSIAKSGATALANEITTMLKAGQDVTIPGLGKFKVITKAARTGRNPRTGEPVAIAEHKAVKFSQTSTLKPILNGA